jgi:hypothetical protein
MYYQMGNFVPWRGAAWALLAERAAVLAVHCGDAARRDDVPESVAAVATAAAGIAARLSEHVPAGLRPA